MLQQILHPPLRLLNNHDLDANFVSNPVDITVFKGISVQFKWSGAPQGALTCQASIDPDVFGWSTLPEGSKTITGASGSDLFDFNGLNFYYFRLVYTRTSGTGLIDAVIGAKQF